MFGKKDSGPLTPPTEQHVSQEEARPVEAVRLADKKIFSHEAAKEGYTHHTEKPEISFTDAKLATEEYKAAKKRLTELLLEKVDFSQLESMTDEAKRERIREASAHILYHDIQVPLTNAQVERLKEQAVDDLLGFGPIEVLMSDSEISDIMINGFNRVFIEKHGKVLLTDVTFSSERHLVNVIQKIVSIVGRRVDEASPMVDARMPDGSRFNAIIPPLALDGSLVSIRKFRKQSIGLNDYVGLGSMSEAMCKFLGICGGIRLNMIISGGTGSGKTTLLNAISGNIDRAERVITIEDAAELQLQQPHVLRMESRPPNMEGAGEVTQRQLVRNALRMRPDRIIIGEIRGDEVIEVLSAMNTGHDGSMATIHANSPRDALSRIENLVGMSAVRMALPSLRNQIASAVHLVVQVSRQRDGKRRVTQIDEIVGLQGENIVTQTLFGFRSGALGEDGVLSGEYYATGATPRFVSQAAYFGKEAELLECLKT
ncbi:MAG: CpaF family protein [Rickettsiales bacterium]